MNKKIAINILLIFSIFHLPLISALNDWQINAPIPVKCALPLQKYINKIQKIPEAKALIEFIQQQGRIQIVNRNETLSNQFGAFWDPDQRVICIAISPRMTEGTIIGTILFELHNASISYQFNHLDRLATEGKIDKASYVKSMEYLEYINSLNAAKIAEKGIQMNIFPSDARLPTYRNFEEHFEMQKRSGHSAYFARNFDNLCKGYQQEKIYEYNFKPVEN
jgi:hypothetical protein